jgi:hypothetical protein
MTSRKLHSPLPFLVSVALVVGPIADARADETPPDDTPPQEIASRILEEDRDVERRVVGLTRFRVSFPQRVSGAVGAMVVRQPARYDCSTVCEYKGLFVQAEPGLSGGELSAGYAVLMGEKGRNEHFLSKVYLGYGIKGALLRTWNDADLTPSDQTLLGIEGDFTIIHVNFSLGLFRHVGSGEADDPWVVTGGIGWGF